VANAGSGTVSVISTATNTVTATIPVGAFPAGVAVNGTAAYVTNSGSGTVSVITAQTSQGTTTAAGDATTAFPASSQNVALSATVTSASTVNEGTVTFTVLDSSDNPVGTATGGAVTNGSAAASYGLPAGLAAGTYRIDASYTDPDRRSGRARRRRRLHHRRAVRSFRWRRGGQVILSTDRPRTHHSST
jgi:YVTN family beta-propeller protein